MSRKPSVLFIIPQGLPDMASFHEATVGMGRLEPAPLRFPYPPQTVAACLAAIREAGLAGEVIDTLAEPQPLADVLARIAGHPADVVAVLVSQGTALADENFLRLLRAPNGVLRAPDGVLRAPDGALRWRQPGRRVLLFGPSAGFVAEEWLAAGLATAALSGEPEGAIAEAVQAVAEGQARGLLAAHSLCPTRYTGDLLADLDGLPWPAWDAIPWHPYQMVSLLSSRGCPAGCHFCAYTVAQGRQFRSQSIERTVAEWAWIARQIQPPYLLIRDPVFAHDRARVEGLCREIIAQRIQLPWACESRPEHFDRDLLRLMRQAGCVTVKIGMESGDPALLAAIGRVKEAAEAEEYLAQVQRVAEECGRLGLRCRVFVLTGLPGQSAESLARTEAALRRLVPQATVHARRYHCYPGTALQGPGVTVPAETLAWLERANQPRPAVWRRAAAALRRRWARVSFPLPRPQLGPAPSPAPAPRLSPGSSLAGKCVFLTGGTGFIGGYVARALTEAGAQVKALVRPGSRLGMLDDLPVEIVEGDLQTPGPWLEALRGCELCFHLAALYADNSQADALYAVNVRGTAALLAACAAAGVRRVVHTSTVGTVGRPARPGCLPDETVPFNLWEQASDYVRSKYLGELVARSWAEAGLEVVIVKPTAPVGAGDRRPTATGQRILAALRGEVTPYPPGGVNHVPVRDVALGHLLAAEHGRPGQCYILGHQAGNLDHAAFLRLVAEAAGTRPLKPPARAVATGYLPPSLTADPSRAIRELGMPQSDLRAAFAEAVAWYLNSGACQGPASAQGWKAKHHEIA